MAATTVISARVNPACKAQTSPDLFLACTVFPAFPVSMFELKISNAFEQLSLGTPHKRIRKFWRGAFRICSVGVTNVSELLYRNILTQPLQASVKIPSK
jgi:hypothetical protein